jgi:nucleoid DNA-binding protein
MNKGVANRQISTTLVLLEANMKKTTNKKMAKTTAKKATTKTAAKKSGGKFSLLNNLHEAIIAMAAAGKNGVVKIKRADLKAALENTILEGAKRAASGERVRFPVIGVLARRDVKGRKAGKGVNPFTGEEIMVKARPESKKPRWSFPKTMKETVAEKKNW